jgi:hypothetical protein
MASNAVTKNRLLPGGNAWEVAGSLDILSGGEFRLAGVPITATAQQINALSGLINADGDIEIANTVWEDLRFPATGINPPGAASDPVRDTSDGRLVFSASATNIIAVQVQMPHAWLPGSSLHPHVHWSPATANSGNVLFQISYKIANVNEAFPADFTTAVVIGAAGGAADKHQLSSFPSIPMTGKTLSCMLLMLIARIGGDDQDTYASTIKLNEFDIHYEIDTLGSAEELTK